MLVVEQIEALDVNDNYFYVIHETDNGYTAAIDPCLDKPVLDLLEDRGWTLDAIFTTHHHWDHIGANKSLQRKTDCRVYGPHLNPERIPGLTHPLKEGQALEDCPLPVTVMEIPGHTLDHLAFYLKPHAALFSGDTIFSIGCGRMFEGTPEQYWRSLSRLKALPEETTVFATHEYTAANLAFARSIEPEHEGLRLYEEEVDFKRQQNLPTVPVNLGQEIDLNPFLRCDDPHLQLRLGMAGRPAAEVFGALRRRKDNFQR